MRIKQETSRNIVIKTNKPNILDASRTESVFSSSSVIYSDPVITYSDPNTLYGGSGASSVKGNFIRRLFTEKPILKGVGVE